jgi:hypothetical protein
LELRVQTNATVSVKDIDQGDPIKFNILVANTEAVTNIRILAAEPAAAGWTLVVQALVYPFEKNGEQMMSELQQEVGARDDRQNVISGVERHAALFNVDAYRIWLLPPGNSFEAEAIEAEAQSAQSAAIPVLGTRKPLERRVVAPTEAKVKVIDLDVM